MSDRSTTPIDEAVRVVVLAVAVAVAVGLVTALPWLSHPEVVPLTLLTAVVLTGPFRRPPGAGGLDLAEPFTLVVVSMALWHFVVGSAAYAFGVQDDVFYLERISGRAGFTVVVTQVMILVGLVSLGMAARAAPAAALAGRLGPVLPRGPERPRDLQVLTWTLLAVGLGASLVGRSQGTLGYVAVSTGGLGAVTGFGSMMAAASPVAFVQARAAGASRRATIAMAAGIGVVIVAQSFVAGNRGTAASYALFALVAATRRRQRFSTRRLVVGGVGAVVLLSTAMAYGSAYRAAATQADGTVSNDLVATAGDALGDLVDRGPGVVGYVADRVTERLDATISAAVVVGQYDDLAEAERTADIDNDLVRTGLGGLVPRTLWADKPSSDPRVLGEVYFGFPNVYATTPIATLLRNFGPWSVAIGMAVVGFLLGVAHRALASPTTWTAARAVLYLVIATRATNLEASLATFLPDASRVIVVGLVTIGLAWCVSRLLDAARGVSTAEPTSAPVEGAAVTDQGSYSLGRIVGWLVVLSCVARFAAIFV